MISSKYECDGQLSIFDFLQGTDFDNMQPREIADFVGKSIGVRFTWDEDLEEFSSCIGKLLLSLDVDTYTVTHYGTQTVEGKRHIGCGWALSSEGGGKPCNSLDEAVDYLKKAVERVRHGKFNHMQ